jgi:hypothetical protein
MSKLKTQRVRPGQIPSERFVDIRTADGTEEQVIVDGAQLEDGHLLVSEIHSEDDRVLVELPREAMSGSWRLWVPRSLVKHAS